MRRKTRPRVVWLPQDPFFSVDAAGLGQSTIMSISDTLGATGNAGETVTVVAPCVRDTTRTVLQAADTLADIENSGYRLRRIVGKIWVGITSRGNDNGPATLCTTAGFIVLRTDTAGIPLSPAANDNYNTTIIDNTQDPWIWRRSWLYANTEEGVGILRQNTLGTPSQAFGASSNQNLGGIADGPHVDAKTARVIGPEERLFLVFSTTVVDPGVATINANVNYIYDLRYLASMKSMIGNRRNASR